MNQSEYQIQSSEHRSPTHFLFILHTWLNSSYIFLPALIQAQNEAWNLESHSHYSRFHYWFINTPCLVVVKSIIKMIPKLWNYCSYMHELFIFHMKKDTQASFCREYVINLEECSMFDMLCHILIRHGHSSTALQKFIWENPRALSKTHILHGIMMR